MSDTTRSRGIAWWRRTGTPGAVLFVGLAGAALAAGLLGAAGCSRDGDEATGGQGAALPGALYDPPRPAAPLRLADGRGGIFDLSKERSRAVAIFFGFSRCPDVCPQTLSRWAEVRRLLGADAERVRFVFVSIDTEHDTPEIAAAFAARFDSTFIGLAGSESEVGETSLAWNVAVKRVEGGEAAREREEGDGGEARYEFVHTTQVFVVDPDGNLRWGYGRATSAEAIAAGLRTTLKPRF